MPNNRKKFCVHFERYFIYCFVIISKCTSFFKSVGYIIEKMKDYIIRLSYIPFTTLNNRDFFLIEFKILCSLQTYFIHCLEKNSKCFKKKIGG